MMSGARGSEFGHIYIPHTNACRAVDYSTKSRESDLRCRITQCRWLAYGICMRHTSRTSKLIRARGFNCKYPATGTIYMWISQKPCQLQYIAVHMHVNITLLQCRTVHCDESRVDPARIMDQSCGKTTIDDHLLQCRTNL